MPKCPIENAEIPTKSMNANRKTYVVCNPRFPVMTM